MDNEDILDRWPKLRLSDEDGPINQLSPSLYFSGIKRLRFCLIGKLIANKELNKKAFMSTILIIWKTSEPVGVEWLGVNMYKFTFDNQNDRKRILEGGPWAFDRYLLALKEVDKNETADDTSFRYVPFWIQLHRLPLSLICKEVGHFLGNLLGQVKEVDTNEKGRCVGRFIRVRVIVDIQQPLKRGLRVQLEPDRDPIDVMLCYERLPNFCFYCGKLGHVVRECTQNTQGLCNLEDFRYGPWLKAPKVKKRKSETLSPKSRTSKAESPKGKHNEVHQGQQGEAGLGGSVCTQNLLNQEFTQGEGQDDLVMQCVFDVLADTDTDDAVPFTWIESDLNLIAKPEMVKLHSFNTKIDKADTLFSYKNDEWEEQ